jgi:hypothetical protein
MLIGIATEQLLGESGVVVYFSTRTEGAFALGES